MCYELRRAEETTVTGSTIVTLAEAAALDASSVGGKAANLARLAATELPVPTAYVVPVAEFERFCAHESAAAAIARLGESGITHHALARAADEVRATIATTPLSTAFAAELARAFISLTERGDAVVVRSSATVEDSASASYAGMLSSIGDVRSAEEMYAAVKQCWASAFNRRAVLYAADLDHDPSATKVAVVLQRQVRSERSGLAFGRDPARREADVVIVEAIQGMGEDLVSGEVTPERYEFSPADDRVTLVSGGSAARPRKLTDREVALLARWTRAAEEVFGTPQDIEWAYADGEFYLLQSRPLVFSADDEMVFPQIGEHTVLVRGVGASPAVGSGEVVHARGDQVHILSPRTVVVLRRLTNDLAVHLRRAAAVVVDEGGATSHGANILREFGVPCVLGTGRATTVLAEGDVVTVDGFRGIVYEGDLALRPAEVGVAPDTGMQVFLSVLVPEQAATLAPHADGVSSLRNDYFLLQSGVHPAKMVHSGRAHELEQAIAEGIVTTSGLFAGKPVWYKTLDAPTDEFRRLDGGDEEPHERNPLLGWRGIGRGLAEPELLDLELRAVRRALEGGAAHVGIKLPFVRFAEEYAAALDAIRRAGIEPHVDVAVGVSVETPGIAMRLADVLALGADFVSVGVSDLVMCVLALDRESERVAHLFEPGHPAVIEVLARIAETARAAGVFTCACGESARDEALLGQLVEAGYDAVGVSLPFFAEVKRRIATLEAQRGR